MKKFSIEMGENGCTCSICRSVGRVTKIKWYEQDYESNKQKGKICKTLQKHTHSVWICEECMEDFRQEWFYQRIRTFLDLNSTTIQHG